MLTLYTLPGCNLCEVVKRELKEAKVAFVETDIEELMLENPEKAGSIFQYAGSLHEVKSGEVESKGSQYGKGIFPVVEIENRLYPPVHARKIAKGKI